MTGPRAPSLGGPAGEDPTAGRLEPGTGRPSTTAGLPIGLVCAGCGYRVPEDRVFAARCPASEAKDDVDHVLRRVVDPGALAFPWDEDAATFVRYRTLSRGYHAARAAGWSDGDVVRLIRRLDDAIAGVDGAGFRETPFEPADELAAGLGSTGAVWVKDETRNVSGSHKARHLMGVMLELLIDESLTGWDRPGPLAIASCGNAALAAAVVARAAGRHLDVFVPTWADESVVARLTGLGANVVACRRVPGEAGDPTFRALRASIADGAVPFTCQGTENGLAIAGGETLGYEMVTRLARSTAGSRGKTAGPELDAVVVQVGGGALASSVAAAFAEARALGVVGREPRLYAVQTAGCAPFARAWRRLRERAATDGMPAALQDARAHHSAYMWPWETEPTSVAHGILDDETYDWSAIAEALARTGGDAVVVDEATVIEANEIGRASTGIDADHTGTAGLAGLLSLRRSGDVHPDETVAVLFTGAAREGGRGEASTGPSVASPQSMERSTP